MRSVYWRRQTKTSPQQLYKLLTYVKKTALRTAILEELGKELARQVKAAEMAHEEAISEESQPENKWDTHSQEAAYLAEGQSKLVMEIRQSIELYQTLALPDYADGHPVAVGMLVGLESGAGTTWYFLGPRAGGLTLHSEGREILVVTPQSPLGRQLVGCRVGDLVNLPGSSKPLRIAVVE